MRDTKQKLSLAFRDRELERQFQDATARAAVRRHRIVWAAGAVLYGIVPLFSRASAGSAANFRTWVAIRMTIVLPIMLSGAALGWAPVDVFVRFRRMAVITGSLALLWGMVATAGTMPDPELFQLRDAMIGVIIGILLVYAIVATRLSVALIAALPATVAMQVVVVWRYPQPNFLTFHFWMIMANVVGVMALWQIEASQREAFLANQRSEQLLHNVLPVTIAERLKISPGAIAERFPEATVLFADIVGFTPLAQQLPPERVVSILDEVFSAFDDIAEKHGLEKIKTIGDAYMVVGGAPTPSSDHASAVATMALDMHKAIARHTPDDITLRLRIGIDTGPVVAGVIGKRTFLYDMWGDTVNTASRMESHGIAGSIQVTPAVYERLRDQFTFESRGLVDVKGKGPMETWLLTGRGEPRPG